MRIGLTLTGAEQLLLNALADANAAAVLHSLRLATDARVSKPSHDPAAFVQISTLESRLSHVGATLTNVETASNIAAQMQLAVDGIRTQLETVRDALVEDEDLALTGAERLEKQAEIDAAIDEINTIATSEIEGRRRLDGSTNYRANGLNENQVRRLQVYSVGDTLIRGTVTTRAEQAELTYTGAAGAITANATFTLTGEQGSVTVTVAQNDDLDDVAEDINQQSHKTGVTAEVDGNELVFTSVNYGSDAIVEFSVSSGTFNVSGGNNDGTAEGVDAVATINDETLTGDGNRFSYSRNGLRFSIEFEGGFYGGFSPITIDDGSVDRFALSTQTGLRTSLGLPGLQAIQFRGLSGSLDQLVTGGQVSGLGSNTSQAIRIVDEALAQLASVEGLVNGFADQAVASSESLLTSTYNSISDTIELVNAVDEEEEALLVAKSQQLAENVVASLAIMSQQRATVLSLLQQIAGF